MKDRFLRWLIRVLGGLLLALYRWQDVPVWRSFDGRVTPIDKMHTNHLLNTIRMIERNGSVKHQQAYPFLLREAMRRGLWV